MNEDWYYSSLGERFGPIARKDLEALVVAGNLKPTDLAWKVGWPDWQPLAIVDEIKNIFNNEQNVMVYWYYSKDGRQLGPIPWQHLKCLVICGNLLPSDLVWAEGMDHWRPAGEIIR